MIEKKTWAEFRAAGLLWWVNRILHLFGWAIVCDVEDDETISEVYPARVKFRGFDGQSEADGFIALTAHIEGTIGTLVKETKE